jgi:hypothetical protein
VSTQSRFPIQPWIIGGLVALSAAYSFVASYAQSRGMDVAESSRVLWLLVYSILITLWSRNDKVYPVTRAKGEYSYLLMFFFWPVVLLYHLVRSRGAEGLMLYLGFALTYMAPYLMQVLIWAAKGHAS